MSRPTRLQILQDFIDEIAQTNYISITNVVVDKTSKTSDYDVFANAWQALFQRFENTLLHGNFPHQLFLYDLQRAAATGTQLRAYRHD